MPKFDQEVEYPFSYKLAQFLLGLGGAVGDFGAGQQKLAGGYGDLYQTLANEDIRRQQLAETSEAHRATQEYQRAQLGSLQEEREARRGERQQLLDAKLQERQEKERVAGAKRGAAGKLLQSLAKGVPDVTFETPTGGAVSYLPAKGGLPMRPKYREEALAELTPEEAEYAPEKLATQFAERPKPLGAADYLKAGSSEKLPPGVRAALLKMAGIQAKPEELADAGEPFTLGETQTRYGPGGKIIAQGPGKAPKDRFENASLADLQGIITDPNASPADKARARAIYDALSAHDILKARETGAAATAGRYGAEQGQSIGTDATKFVMRDTGLPPDPTMPRSQVEQGGVAVSPAQLQAISAARRGLGIVAELATKSDLFPTAPVKGQGAGAATINAARAWLFKPEAHIRAMSEPEYAELITTFQAAIPALAKATGEVGNLSELEQAVVKQGIGIARTREAFAAGMATYQRIFERAFRANGLPVPGELRSSQPQPGPAPEVAPSTPAPQRLRFNPTTGQLEPR